jgi:serine/threonine protein kinase
MAQAFDAEVDEQGQVRLLSPLPEELRGMRRRAVVVLIEDAAQQKTALSSGSRYEIVKQLGVGGMGAVYLAQDRGTGQRVCLKRLSAGIDLRNVRQECAALERLRHPGIVGLIDRSLEGEAPYLVMEHAAGVDLARYLRRRGALPEQTVVPLLARMLEALDYAHSQQVIHRDLKPANVMVQFNWQSGRLDPKILDFGIAIVGNVDYQGQITGQGNPFGTPNYMSPEQMRGEVITPAADLYALGQMAWELVTGLSAFTGHAREIAIRKVTGQGGLQLPEITRFDVSADFRRWIEACTQADRNCRPSVREALAELQRMERGLPVGVAEGPTCLAIEDASQGALPGGWCDGTGFVGGASAQVQFAFPAHQAHNFRKLTMRLPAGSGGFGCLA